MQNVEIELLGALRSIVGTVVSVSLRRLSDSSEATRKDLKRKHELKKMLLFSESESVCGAMHTNFTYVDVDIDNTCIARTAL
jgi:glucose-6-phosphate-specific signal transduction histidine kinase